MWVDAPDAAAEGDRVTRVPRAERFPIVTRVLWRACAERDWTESVSVNVSRSGLLFHTKDPISVGTKLELIFALSWEPSNPLDTADVRCEGHVVRTEAGSAAGTAVASTIEFYSLIQRIRES